MKRLRCKINYNFHIYKTNHSNELNLSYSEIVKSKCNNNLFLSFLHYKHLDFLITTTYDQILRTSVMII